MSRREQLTIDDLAARTGVSSRSIRYYQTRGLLSPPEVKGRQGFYDERHIERLALIAELQAEGLNLQAIGWLLSGAGQVDSEELRRLKRTVLDSWVSEVPVTISAGDLPRAMALREWDDDTARRAVRLKLLERVEGEEGEEGSYRVLLPSVLAAGGELVDMGLPVTRVLDVLEAMRRHAEAVAEAYVEIFDEAVLAPWDARGRPDGEWGEITAAVDRIRPLAGEALLAVFRQVMADVIADHLQHTVPTGPD